MGPRKGRDVQEESGPVEGGHLEGERVGAGGELPGGGDGEANEIQRHFANSAEQFESKQEGNTR